MMINVKVIANAKRNFIKKENNNYYKIYVSVPATKGKANKAIILILSKYFNIKKSQVSILHGHHSSYKMIEIK
jgi:hypothetical protein